MTANRKKEKIRYNPRLQNFFTSKWIHVIINPLCEFTYGRYDVKKTKKSKESVQGFTLVELIIIVAILGVLVAILAPAYTKYIEKSREATDLANAKSAYNELMINIAEKEETPEPISFKLKQKHPGWQSPLPITVGSASFDGTNTDNWVGTPGRNGTCVVSYDKNKGVIFTWSGGTEDAAARPTYKGEFDRTLKTLKDGYNLLSNANMNNNKAYYSNQTFKIDGKQYTTRVYYADSPVFKKALEGYTPKPASYDQSPFCKVENDYDHFTHQGFAYYTYGKDGSINMFTYVNENKVYQTTDEGKNWQDITPNEK